MDLPGLAGRTLRRVVASPPPADLFPGRMMELPGRGTTFVVDVPGPEGAPTLILLHALATTAYLSWFPSLGELSKHFRVVTFDQRWHGHGIQSPRFRLEDLADDTAAVADALGIERFVTVGYSMGGIVAQLVWRRHGDRLDGLVLCAATRNFQGTRRERVALKGLHAAMTPLGRYARTRSSRLAATLDQCPAPLTAAEMDVSTWAMREFRSTSYWAMFAAVAEITAFDSAPWIAQVNVPTSVVVVANDHLIPTRRQRRLAECIPGATAYEVAGSHAALVLGAGGFVPVLLDACLTVTGKPQAA